jgi:hypothetical protein
MIVDRHYLVRLIQFEHALGLFFAKLPVDVDLVKILRPDEVAERFRQACADAGLDTGTVELLELGPFERRRLRQIGLRGNDCGLSPADCTKLVKAGDWTAEHQMLWYWTAWCARGAIGEFGDVLLGAQTPAGPGGVVMASSAALMPGRASA